MRRNVILFLVISAWYLLALTMPVSVKAETLVLTSGEWTGLCCGANFNFAGPGIEGRVADITVLTSANTPMFQGTTIDFWAHINNGEFGGISIDGIAYATGHMCSITPSLSHCAQISAAVAGTFDIPLLPVGISVPMTIPVTLTVNASACLNVFSNCTFYQAAGQGVATFSLFQTPGPGGVVMQGFSATVTAVPEPTAGLLFGTGMIALGWMRARAINKI